MTAESLIALAGLLFVKHFLADGPLQTDRQVANKGVWLHPDGLAHAGTHVGLTALCFGLWIGVGGVAAPLGLLLALLAAEFVIHYAIDFAKSRIDASVAWASRTVDASGRAVLQIHNSNFFILFLADQALHSLTYVALLLCLSWV